jgi:hypothetical protein
MPTKPFYTTAAIANPQLHPKSQWEHPNFTRLFGEAYLSISSACHNATAAAVWPLEHARLKHAVVMRWLQIDNHCPLNGTAVTCHCPTLLRPSYSGRMSNKQEDTQLKHNLIATVISGLYDPPVRQQRRSQCGCRCSRASCGPGTRCCHDRCQSAAAHTLHKRIT